MRFVDYRAQTVITAPKGNIFKPLYYESSYSYPNSMPKFRRYTLSYVCIHTVHPTTLVAGFGPAERNHPWVWQGVCLDTAMTIAAYLSGPGSATVYAVYGRATVGRDRRPGLARPTVLRGHRGGGQYGNDNKSIRIWG